MKLTLKSILLGLTVASIAAVLIACGGSTTNNEQGVSFTLFSFTPSSLTARLSTDTGDGSSSPSLQSAYGLQNNLVGQGIRVQRAFLSYYVEGASQQPPSTTVAVSGLLGPAGTNPNASLPPSFVGIGPTAQITADVVTPDVLTWLNLNRSKLPETPFAMTVRAVVTGITTAGDRLDTNELELSVTVLTDNPINPEAGSGAGTSDTGV